MIWISSLIGQLCGRCPLMPLFKCKVLHLGKLNQLHDYLLEKHLLESVDERLGFVLDSLEMIWNHPSSAKWLILKQVNFLVWLQELLLLKVGMFWFSHIRHGAATPGHNRFYIKDKQLFEYTKHRFSHGFRVEDVAIWRSFSFKERWKCAHLIKVFKLYRGYSLLPFEQILYSKQSCWHERSFRKDREASLSDCTMKAFFFWMSYLPLGLSASGPYRCCQQKLIQVKSW